MNKIPKFELLNENISVNVLHLEPDGVIIPAYASKYRDRQLHVNLMLLVQGFCIDSNGNRIPCPDLCATEFKTHYILVKSLSRLSCSRTRHNGLIFVCPYCLHRFYKRTVLDLHVKDCSEYAPCRITFPLNKLRVVK